MKKDSSVKFGTTKCDFCNDPATNATGVTVTCDKCSQLIKGASDVRTLKSAGITLRHSHK